MVRFGQLAGGARARSAGMSSHSDEHGITDTTACRQGVNQSSVFSPAFCSHHHPLPLGWSRTQRRDPPTTRARLRSAATRHQRGETTVSSHNSTTPDFGANEWMVEEMRDAWLKDPTSVSPQWRSLFESGRLPGPSSQPAPAQPATKVPQPDAPSPAPAATPSSPVPSPASPRRPRTPCPRPEPAPHHTARPPLPRTSRAPTFPQPPPLTPLRPPPPTPTSVPCCARLT